MMAEGKKSPPSGMAWGSNSPSRKRSASSASTLLTGNHGDGTDGLGDFGRYFAEKKRKLRLQFQSDASKQIANNALELASSKQPLGIYQQLDDGGSTATTSGSLKKLFEGVSIFVNGFTVPSHQELRNLMAKHGGRFENYFTKEHVTHIICSTLPDSKIKDLRSFSRGIPVVKPSWIVDSIAAGRILPVSSYYLERLIFESPKQGTLSAFFGSKNKRAEEPCSFHAECNTSFEKGLNAATEKELAAVTSETFKEAPPESDLSNINGKRPQTALACEQSPLKEKNESLAHSTLGDTNFVQNFFKNSRLHFIGTWRTRYQSRFGTKAQLVEQQKSNTAEAGGIHTNNSVFMHIDMDCFFVSVVIRNQPHLIDKPVAVSHSDNAFGTAEISSANYPARAFGIKAGMFIRDAKALCPSLEIVPYNFEAYEQVADQFYDILHERCNKVQAMSCDEASLDVSGLGDPVDLATAIRKEVFQLTKCTASVGIGSNLLLARMATRKAKPDGLYHIRPEQVDEFMADISVDDLPGVGWALQQKLHTMKVFTCTELRTVLKETLQKEFGLKTGEMLWRYSRGIDDRQVQSAQERKSIGAEVSWGVRFNGPDDAQHFLATLCKEVCARLQGAGTCGRTFTLKLKKRKEGAKEPVKFMGCGSCDTLSKSSSVGSATDNVDIILHVCRQLFASFHVDVREVRGVGLQVTKLEPATGNGVAGSHQGQRALGSWLSSNSKHTSEKILEESSEQVHGYKSMASSLKLNENVQEFAQAEPKDDMPQTINQSNKNRITPAQDSFSHGLPMKGGSKEDNRLKGIWGKVLKGPFSEQRKQKAKREKVAQETDSLPPVTELDCSVLAALPAEILSEINKAYNGAVSNYMVQKSKPTSSEITAGLSKKDGPLSYLSAKGTNPASVGKSIDYKSINDGGFSGPESNALNQGSENHLLPSTSTGGLKNEKKTLAIGTSYGCIGNKECSGFRTTNNTEEQSETVVPMSLSQVDMATLRELPLQLQEDILKSLPTHRSMEEKVVNGNVVVESLPEQSNEASLFEHLDKTREMEGFWLGSPPKWVALFSGIQGVGGSALMARGLAQSYSSCLASRKLSNALIHFISCFPRDDEYSPSMEMEPLIGHCLDLVLELIKQYIHLKISSDIEEVYMVSRVLKRMGAKSKFWAAVEALVYPIAEAMVVESYGGKLAL